MLGVSLRGRALSVQFSRSVVSDSLRPHGFPVHHQFRELAQTHVHRVGDTIQPSHPLWSPSPAAFNLSQHQDLFWWVSSLQSALLFFFPIPERPLLEILRSDFRNCWNRHFLICWERWPSPWNPLAPRPAPVHLGERWVFPLLFCFPSSLLSSQTNSFLEACSLLSCLTPSSGVPTGWNDKGQTLRPSEGHLEALRLLNPESMLWILIHVRRLRVF